MYTDGCFIGDRQDNIGGEKHNPKTLWDVIGNWPSVCFRIFVRKKLTFLYDFLSTPKVDFGL